VSQPSLMIDHPESTIAERCVTLALRKNQPRRQSTAQMNAATCVGALRAGGVKRAVLTDPGSTL
jgi:hypothetical protein